MLARLYKEGNGVSEDFHRAKEYLEKACELEAPQGMYLMGRALLEGNWEGIEKDQTRGKELI